MEKEQALAAMKLSVLTRMDEALALREAWASLDEACRVHPFSGPDVFLLWWKHFGEKEGYAPRIVIALRGEELVGVLPLALSRKGSVRLLALMGKVFFDYGGVLAKDQDVAAALWREAETIAFDTLLIEDVSLSSAEGRAWQARARRIQRNGAPRMELVWSDSAAWCATHSKHRRTKMRHSRKKLENRGAVRFEGHQEPLPRGTVETMLRFKRATTAGRDEGSVIYKEGIEAFFEELFQDALSKGRGFWGVLKCGDADVAYVFDFCAGATHFGYMLSFDRNYAEASPGFLSLDESIAWAIDHGVKVYDFMRGAEEYKSRYTGQYEDLPTFVWGKTAKGKIFAWLYQQAYLYLKPLKYKWIAFRDKKR